MSENEQQPKKKVSDEVQSFYDAASSAMQQGKDEFFNFLDANKPYLESLSVEQRQELVETDLDRKLYQAYGKEATQAYNQYRDSAPNQYEEYDKLKNNALSVTPNPSLVESHLERLERQDVLADIKDAEKNQPAIANNTKQTPQSPNTTDKNQLAKVQDVLDEFKTFRNGVGKDDAATLQKVASAVGIDIDTSKLGRRGLPIGEEKALEEKFKEIVQKGGKITEEDRTKLGAMFADTESKFKGQPSGVEPPAVAKSQGQVVEAGRSS